VEETVPPRSFFPPIEVSPWRRRLHLAAFFLLGLYANWANLPTERPITIDNQLYYYVAERVASGVPPHISLVDHKHALSSMVSGAAIAIGRMTGMDDVMAARTVSVLLTALIAPALWIAAYELTKNAVVAHLTAAIFLTFTDFFAQAAMGVRPQVFMAAFLAFAFALIARGRFALGGALAVAAFLCWQPALIVWVALLAALALRAPPRNALYRAAAAGIATFLLYEAYFLYHGALGEQLRQSFAMAGDLDGFALPAMGASLRFVLRGGTWGIGWKIALPALYLAFLVALVVEAYTRPQALLATARSESLATALAIAALLTLAFTLVEHQAYPDRYFIQPFVALANGIVLGWALCRGTSRFITTDQGRVRLSGLIFMLALVGAATTVVPISVGRNAGLTSQRALATRTAKLRERYGSLWAVGCPHLLALERLDNYDPFGIFIDKRVRSYAAKRGIDGVYRPAGGVMPPVILTARHGIRQAMPWITLEYRKVLDAGLNRQGVLVWIREECLPSGPCTDALTCPLTTACGGSRPSDG
jgi:hypothetical protein